MASIRKNKSELAPGIAVECESGSYIAYYEHRTDVIANGKNEMDARKNLRKMMKTVLEFEKEEQDEADNSKKKSNDLPPHAQTKHFTDEIPSL